MIGVARCCLHFKCGKAVDKPLGGSLAAGISQRPVDRSAGHTDELRGLLDETQKDDCVVRWWLGSLSKAMPHNRAFGVLRRSFDVVPQVTI